MGNPSQAQREIPIKQYHVPKLKFASLTTWFTNEKETECNKVLLSKIIQATDLGGERIKEQTIRFISFTSGPQRTH